MSDTSPQACMAAFTAALLRRDLAAALALLSDDVVFFYSNGTALWGKDAFGASITAGWKRIANYAYTSGDQIWLARSGDAATAIYTFSWSGKADGKEVGGSGRGTRVFRREPGGWRIVHEHLSAGQWKPGAA